MGFLLAVLSEKPPWWDAAWASWALVGMMVGLARVELATRSLGNCCSIHLSYSPTRQFYRKRLLPRGHQGPTRAWRHPGQARQRAEPQLQWQLRVTNRPQATLLPTDITVECAMGIAHFRRI